MATDNAPWTVLRLINWTRDFFQKASFEEPRLCAEVLLAYALGCKRIELYTRFNYEPTPDERTRFKALIQRAQEHEPIAYIVGEKEFYSLKFKITPDVLVPRSETEMLVREAVEHLHRLGPLGNVWDACTGSGCVAVAIASQVRDAMVLATDISEVALAVARENAELNKVADRVKFCQANLLDRPADCSEPKLFEVITANPPYVAANQYITESVRREPAIAVHGGKEGLDFIGPIVTKAPDLLRSGGALIMEYGFGQADVVRDLLVATGEFAEPKIFRDHQDIERSVMAVRK